MKVGVKKLLRAGKTPARTWGACSRVGSHGKVKIEETDGSCCGQKEHDTPFFVREGIRA